MIRLSAPLVNALLAQPESGMGYQRVEVEMVTGLRETGVAYNAELVLLEREPRQQLRSAYEALMKAATPSEGRVKAVRVVRPPSRVVAAVQERMMKSAPGEAKDAPVGETSANEVFKRFSAFANDRRVQADGSLSAGTYATTEADAKNVHTGAQAVARYALANPEPASYMFTSRPYARTAIQRGTVAPAHGQPGGGVEVIFTSGTQPKTTTGPVKIPD